MALTNRQRVFVEEYLQCWNATEAATRAGYSPKTAQEQSSRLLSKVIVKRQIERRIGELKATTDEVLLRLASHSRGNMDDFLDGRHLSLEQARERGKMHLIKKYKITSRTDDDAHVWETAEIELYDAQAATVQLAKILGQFVERIEIHDWRKEAADAGLDPDALAAELFAKAARPAEHD